MNGVGFRGFPAGLFEFFGELAENNSKDWFDQHRRRYETDVLTVIKSFVADLGPTLRMLNDELATEPRVGRTISRINNDLRFNKARPPYRPYVYARFPRRGAKWTSEALLYVGFHGHGVSVGFYPGGYKEQRRGPVQKAVKDNLRLFQRYLDEQRIAEKYWELAGGESGAVTKWPLPKSARRWVNLESFTVGEYFSASAPLVRRRAFLDRAQEILFDLYPLYLFATSSDIKNDLDSYRIARTPLSDVSGL
ncbi:MAG TPA: DUF2461 family protein [Blastocatellia bacterium]|nr:DUF2461 family protein [Blastocatellia bacterium]